MQYRSKKGMCKRGMRAYDYFMSQGNSPQEANKLSSDVCSGKLKISDDKLVDLPKPNKKPLPTKLTEDEAEKYMKYR
jgi:hypothetical protein